MKIDPYLIYNCIFVMRIQCLYEGCTRGSRVYNEEEFSVAHKLVTLMFHFNFTLLGCLMRSMCEQWTCVVLM